jgi:hypothetical protein
MGFCHIPDGDNLFRHSIHPLSFASNKFVVYKFIHLVQESDGSLLTSITWERYLPTTKYVHGYGCRLALRMNERLKEQNKFQKKNRRVYCGAYQLGAKAIRALPSVEGLEEILSADVVHHIEDGEIAHTDLRIVLKNSGDPGIEGTKTAIVDRLWNTCSGPLRHTCDFDQDLTPHPRSGLSNAPKGPYSDSRSGLQRLWHVVRFRLCKWLFRRRLAAP